MDGIAEEKIFPFGGIVQHPDDIEQAGFTRTGRSHDRNEFTFLYMQVDILENEIRFPADINPFRDAP